MITFTIFFLYLFLLLGSVFIYYAPFFHATNACDDESLLPNAGRIAPHRHSCRYCRQICIAISPDLSNERGLLIHLNLTYKQVLQPEARDCPLLERTHDASTAALSVRIWSQLQTFFDIFSVESDLHALTGCNTFLDRARYFARGLSNRPFHLRIGHLSSEAGGSLRARVLYTTWRLFEFEVSADHGNEASRALQEPINKFIGDPAAAYVLGRPVTLEAVSQQDLVKARGWLDECSHDRTLHPYCLQHDHDFVPTRLIEIEQHVNGSLVLRIEQHTKGQRVEWACLSYCWGGDQPSKTTRANLAARRVTLPLADLPRTIRDAVHVAWSLQIRYLWIDALCIIQDHADDVAREIATMPEIYMYGACTISASRATSSEEGFLQGHVVDEIHHKPISLLVVCPDGATGNIYLSNPGSEYRYAKEPIHTRAWCYQERVLSPRIIDFGHTQIQWICKSKRYADGGRIDSAARTDALIQGTLEGLSQRELLHAWSDIVSKYSRRDITFAGDRLLAVSAIAAYFAPLLRCDYLAGHWRDLLSLELGWIVGQPKYPRPKTYVSPSWSVSLYPVHSFANTAIRSWASISDHVYWDMLDEHVSTVEIVDCKVQLARPFAPFGAVKNGYLIVKAQIRQVTWYFNHSNRQVQVMAESMAFMANRETAESLPGYLSSLFEGIVIRDALEPDWPQDVDANLQVSCLKVRERSQKGDTLCLFLVPAQDVPGGFRRIASFRIMDALYRFDPPIESDFFSGCALHQVKIV
jgi:hypothetical protein